MSDTRSAVIAGGRDRERHAALHLGIAAATPAAPAERWTLANVDTVELGRGDRQAVRTRDGAGDRLLRVTMPDDLISTNHARLTRLGHTWVLEDVASKNGSRVGGRSVKRHTLKDADVIEVGATTFVFRDHGGERGDHHGPPTEVVPGIATASALLVDQLERLTRAAPTALPIVICGETGTGKELAARAVHVLGKRSGAFIAVNCGALAATLVEGELFGHKKGAYSGADTDRSGLVRAADGGTLFLDEIAELSLAAQVTLLRVLQESEVLALGTDRAVSVDLRVVSASHEELEAEVAAGEFREDLYARLAGVAVTLLPLRDRVEDLAYLVAQRIGVRPVTFTPEAVRALYAYAWPRNVRELGHAIDAALALGGKQVDVHHLPAALQPAPHAPEPTGDEERALRATLIAALERHAGNITAVAKDLGKDRTQIRRWLRKFGLSR